MGQTKQELRREMLKMRRTISDSGNRSLTIQKNLLSYIEKRAFERILAYVSYRYEVETLDLIEELLRRSYVVGVPRVRGQQMDFLQISSLSDLTKGSYGILEPQQGTILLPTKNSLFLVPGVAFDRSGGRMGYGGGFYDRYFARYGEGYKMGIAFEQQLLQELPLEETDYRMDGIITEDGAYEFDRNGTESQGSGGIFKSLRQQQKE